MSEDHGLAPIPRYPVEALPAAAQQLVRLGEENGLPAALLGGASIGALAAAIGSRAEIQVTPMWFERAILWVALLAPRGAGKSPAMGLALEPVRRADADENPSICLGDQTMEALARSLAEMDGAALLDLDELALLLRGLGEYKRVGGDQGRLLSLWAGSPWSYKRVGAGTKDGGNAVDLRIARPTLAIVGGLQPPLHGLLGGDADGLRPRWLPHLAELPAATGALSDAAPCLAWPALLRTMLDARDVERTWTLDPAAKRSFEAFRCVWKSQARGKVPAGVAAALMKADVHLARIALALAEAEAPGAGGVVDDDTMMRAATIVVFTLDCWRALPEQGDGFGLSRRDQVLDQAVSALVMWLEEHNGEATRREILRAHVAGVRKAGDVDALLGAYEETYPGSVKVSKPDRGGTPTTIVRAPVRNSVSPLATARQVLGETNGVEPNPPVSPLATPGLATANLATPEARS